MFLLLKGFRDKNVTNSFLIAKNTEKFKYVSCYQIATKDFMKRLEFFKIDLKNFRYIEINEFFCFKDSYFFLNFSLDKLVQDHKTRHSEFVILKQSKLCEDRNGIFSQSRYSTLLKGKSVIPYEKITVSTG